MADANRPLVACRNMRQRLLDEADRAERADCT
jgi:hypothetical protein